MEATVDDGHTARHYTVSGVTPGGFEVEVALHGHGPGSAWGASVAVGDTVRVSAPKAYCLAPAPHVPRVLIGDAAALPAVARILAEARADERFRVVIELASQDDARSLPTMAEASIDWRVAGNGLSASAVVESAAHEVETVLAGAAPGQDSHEEPAPCASSATGMRMCSGCSTCGQTSLRSNAPSTTRSGERIAQTRRTGRSWSPA